MRASVLLFNLIFCCCLPSMLAAQAPAANFTSDVTSGCATLQVTFTDISTNNPASWKWDFGNNVTSTSQHPRATYSTPGTYTITLIASNAIRSDTIIKTAYIQVYAKPVIDFSSLFTNSCKVPFEVNFQNNSTGATSWLWSFGDNTTSTDKSPTHTYRSSGNLDVTLTGTSLQGCTATLTKAGFIKIRPATFTFSNLPATGCVPFTYTPKYTLNSVDPVTSYLWDFGNGYKSTESNPSYTYTTTGLYNFKLIYTTSSGCKDSVIVQEGVSVGDKTIVDFTANPNVTCGKQMVSFSPIVSQPLRGYQWQFGDGISSTSANPIHRYTDTGKYAITLTVDKGGCKSSVTKNDFIAVGGTIARFTFQKDCINRGKITFKNNSIGGSAYMWNFGDDNTSSETDPVHNYTKEGTYSVSLISIKNEACRDTQTVSIIIAFGGLDVTATEDTICRGNPAFFTLVHPNAKSISIVKWDYGDGANSESQSLVVRQNYRKAGNYTLSIITTDIYGCKDTLVKPDFIRVNGPVANFGADILKGCRNTIISFQDTSVTDGVHPIKKWEWNFGDGKMQQYAQPPFQHTFDTAGIFDVKMKITDASGCSDSLTRSRYITISEGKAGFVSPDTLACSGNAITFKDVSIGQVESYLWHFGDGKTSTLANPVHVYQDTGLYTVKLAIKSSSGCIDSLIKTNYINLKNPKASFGISDQNNSCIPLQINFIDSSYNAKSWFWEFADGNTSTTQNPSYVFSKAGPYNVRLTVTGFGGCQSKFSRNVTVTGTQGSFTYSPLTGCDNNNTVTYKAIATRSSDFTWDFNDGTIINSKDSVITHSYKVRGSFVPKLIYKDAGGCTVNLVGKDTIFIKGVTANLYSIKQNICENTEVQFFDSSITNAGSIIYKWNFGDGKTSSLKNPRHTYATSGNYNVQLIVISENGCTDSVIKSDYIKVVKYPVPGIISETEACEPATITFDAKLTPDTSSIISWVWNFGNGQTSSVKNPPAQVFNSAGIFTNSLTVTNSSGCSSKVNNTITVHPVPNIVTKDTTICFGDKVQLFVTGASSYRWSPSVNLSCTYCNNPVASPTKDQTYKVISSASAKCANEDSIIIKVIQPFTVNVVKPLDSACIGETIQLQANGAHKYLWTPSASISANNISNPFVKPANDISYTVIGYDSLGCFRDTAGVDIKVYPYPTVEFGPDILIIAGNTKTITPLYTGTIATYVWTPARDLNCYTCPTVVLTARDNITYKLKVSNAAGCSAEDVLRVIVTCDKSTVFLPNTFSPNSDGMNDVFYPRGNGIHSISSMRIVNRWGELVFFKKGLMPNDPSDGWDGMYKGKRADAGVYIYEVEILCKNSQFLKFTGNLSLIQ